MLYSYDQNRSLFLTTMYLLLIQLRVKGLFRLTQCRYSHLPLILRTLSDPLVSALIIVTEFM